MKWKMAVLTILILFHSGTAFAGGASPSGKTADNLITEIRYYLSPGDSYWTDAELLAWINDAVQNINLRDHVLESSQMFTVSTGTSEYALSTYLSIKGVLYQTGVTAFKSLLKGKFEDIGFKDPQYDKPTYWYEYNGKCGIYPLKDTKDHTSSGNTIYVLTVPISDTLVGASAIPTPALFDRAIIYYATGQALMKDRQFGFANQFMSQYFSELDRIRIDILDSEKSIWDIITPKNNQAPAR